MPLHEISCCNVVLVICWIRRIAHFSFQPRCCQQKLDKLMLQSKLQGVHAKSLADDTAAWCESLTLRESKQQGKETPTCAVAAINLSHRRLAANHACLTCMMRLCKTLYLRYITVVEALHTRRAFCVCVTLLKVSRWCQNHQWILPGQIVQLFH